MAEEAPMEPEKRAAPDGIIYSLEEFLQHYGQEHGRRRWDNAAPPLSAREHTFDADATENSNAPVSGEQHAAVPVSATQHTIDADATELSDPPSTRQHIFTLEDAESMRRARLDRDDIHTQMRETLYKIRYGEHIIPDVLVRDVPNDTPWREYIAIHKQWRDIIGSGIRHFSLQFFQDQPDANVFGQLRCDFVAQQCQPMACRLHPAQTPKGDAQLLFIPTNATEHHYDISGYLRAPCHAGPYHMADILAVPPSTRLGKKAAWQIFQRLPQTTQLIDITMHYPWIRLVANTNKQAATLVADGIGCVYALRQDHYSTVTLQLWHLSGSKSTIRLSMGANGKVALSTNPC